MQLLYEIDLRGEGDLQTIRRMLSLREMKSDLAERAWEMAIAAWSDHAEADHIVAELAPDWPTGRQPPVDRAIMRLAYYEMRRGHAPVVVAINEAMKLADEFAGEHTPAFINGVLDKVASRLRKAGQLPEPADHQPVPSEKDWLADALDSSSDATR